MGAMDIKHIVSIALLVGGAGALYGGLANDKLGEQARRKSLALGIIALAFAFVLFQHT